jgi:L-fuconate dehydratase
VSSFQIRRLTLESLEAGFNVFKLKVGADLEDDLRRARLVRSIIDDPANMPKNRKPIDPATIEGKNAGPTGCVLMVDANQVWDVPQAIEYMKHFEKLNVWFIEVSRARRCELPNELTIRSQPPRMMPSDTPRFERRSSRTVSVLRPESTRTTESVERESSWPSG